MKKTLRAIILFCCFLSNSNIITAQTLTFSENFIYNSTNNCPQWTTFQNAINPGIYTGIRMYGSFDPVGITCNDPVIANAMATAIKNSTAYLSPVTSGHTWSVCNRYQAEVWIDPPSLCDGGNCPNPGYLMRPCFGTSNFGGVNTATCSTIPTQTMSIDLIAPPPCAAPTGVNATNVTISGAQLSWAPVSGSAGYEYVIDQIPGSPAGSGTATASTSVPIGGLNINTTYYFHVRNKCTSILYSLWTTLQFTTSDAYCKPPVNVLYSNLTTNSVDVLWSKMPTADYYNYKVDLTTAQPAFPNFNTTTSISAYIPNLLYDTKYYVHLRSICLNGDDSSAWKLDSFVTKNYCGMPELNIVNANTNNPGAWWHTVDNAVSYEYRLANFDLEPSFGIETKDTAISLALPTDGSDQYLFVRTKCRSQFSFSQWASKALRLNPNSIMDIQGNENTIAIYPNPVKDRFIIITNNAVSGSYTLTDITGRVLLTGKVAKDAEVNLSSFANGAYMFKYIINNKTGIIKLVKE